MTDDRHRGIGLPQGTALYVAAVLGTGILLLPALAARAAGPGAILAVAALAVISVPLASTFAALSTRHPDAGGVATFARRAFGPTAARIVGYWFYFGTPIGAPVAAIMTAQYVVAIIGGDRGTVILIAAALVIVPTAITVFGVRFAGWAQLLLSAALMAILVLALAAAAPHVHPANFAPFLPHGLGGVGIAVSLYIWAFAGWEAVAGIAGEFSRPRRDIPRATALALARKPTHTRSASSVSWSTWASPVAIVVRLAPAHIADSVDSATTSLMQRRRACTSVLASAAPPPVTAVTGT